MVVITIIIYALFRIIRPGCNNIDSVKKQAKILINILF